MTKSKLVCSVRAANAVVMAAAVTAASLVPGAARAEEFSISTTGATALSAITRARGVDSATGNPLAANRGIYSLGKSSMVVGATTYTLDGNGTYLGIRDKSSIAASEPALADDRLVYYYHERGSVNGVNDLILDNGLNLNAAGPAPKAPTVGNPLWVQGYRYVDSFAPYNPGSGAETGGYTVNGGNPQPTARIAWSDVRTDQAFAISATAQSAAANNRKPTEAGYGLGRGNVGTKNFQSLTNQNTILGGIDPATTRLRNETLAIVPFTLSANPGTGLDHVTETDTKWLQATGRLSNGANFNSVTRDVGSGTRNQGALNVGLDPSFASGERDRKATAGYTVGGTGADAGTYVAGDEVHPDRGLASSSRSRNEDRISSVVRFADKTSGSSRLRPVVEQSRMALGILSAGDVSTKGTSATSSTPLRVLGIEFNENNSGNGEPSATYVQPTAQNVANGQYQMWSAAQAVTVTPENYSVSSDVTDPTAAGYANGRPILNDQKDEAGGTGPGIHRKFLDNLTGSISTLGAASTNVTPGDAIIAQGFIPQQLMNVRKTYDGDVQQLSARSTVDPDDDGVTNGPGLSAAAVWDLVKDPGEVLHDKLAWVAAGSHNGDLGVSTKYFIYGNLNTLSTSAANADKTVTINSRTNLAGDFNNDQVRDLDDVGAMAMAYANPSAYLGTPAGDPALGQYNGAAVAASAVTVRTGTVAENPAIAGNLLGGVDGNEGLIVLSDLNSNGNVVPAGNDTVAIEKADVKFFLYGAAVDTKNANTLTGYEGSTDATVRREDGVRTGRLKKNAAIDSFNSTLNTFVGTMTNPATGLAYTQGEINVLKFDKFDVNGDGVTNRADAQYVDRNVSRDFTLLSDVLATNDDLVSAELNDNNSITATLTAGTSDFKLIRDAVGAASLLDGDADFNGTVNFADFSVLVNHYNLSADRWSLGDFNLDGTVTFSDFSALVNNYNLSALNLLVVDANLMSLTNSEIDFLESKGITVAVPEPTTFAVVGAAALLGLRRRSRRPVRAA